MKQKGPHPHKKLSPPTVAALKKPGRYSDGDGLYLVVSPTGNKKWILRTVVQGRRTDIGLGGLSTTTLKKARLQAAEVGAAVEGRGVAVVAELGAGHDAVATGRRGAH